MAEPIGAAHLEPTEATIANAGAQQCALFEPFDVGQLLRENEFAVGFGERGGMVAWSTSTGIHLRPIDETGAFTGVERGSYLPSDVNPVQIAPVGQGFVVVGKRVLRQLRLCEGRCVDPTCSGWPAGTPQPQVCSYGCPKTCYEIVRHEFLVTYVDSSGKNIGESNSWFTGLVDIEAVLFGAGRSLAILTGGEIVWVHTNARPDFTTKRQSLPVMPYVLPIRGRGKPSMLTIGHDGSMRLVDERGEQVIRGTIGDARSGRILDARLQARWDSNDQLHIAKQAWMNSLDSIQYSYVEQGEVHTREEIQRGGFREPFAEYVEPHLEDGKFRRRSWLQRSIGEDIDLQARDPDADVRHAQFVWTGKTFLFVYPLVTTPHNLRGIVVDCSGRAFKPG